VALVTAVFFESGGNTLGVIATDELSAVIAREGGRSSKHRNVGDYWMPRMHGA